MSKSILSKGLEGIIKLRGKACLKSKAAPDLPAPVIDFIKESRSTEFTVGFSKAVMLPDDIDKKKYYIAGYGENNPARGVIDPQYAHAIYIDDNSGRGGIVIISLDIVGLLNKDVCKIRRNLKDFCEKSGCRHISVVSTHNHAGIDTMGIWGPLPFSGKDEKFMEILFNAVHTCVTEAYENRKNGKLYLGTVKVPDMQEDIRTPVVYSDTLTRLRFVPKDDSNEIWLLNFASHSESLQGCNHLVSADFPCYLRERIKDISNADVLYTVGAIGGMISMDIPDESTLKAEHRLLESTRKIGYKLADYALGINNDIELNPLINFATKEFYVKVDNPVLTIACDIGILEADKYTNENNPNYWQLKTEITYFEIGGKKILLLPCEIFPELVFGGALSAEESATGKGPDFNPPLIKDIVDDEEIVVFGLANDEIGYVVTPNDFLLHETSPYINNGKDSFGRKHYEETNSMGPDTAYIIAEALKSLMESIK